MGITSFYAFYARLTFIADSAARWFPGASAPEYDPKQVDLLPRRPVSWPVQRPQIRGYDISQTVGHICCRQPFPSGLRPAGLPWAPGDVWQLHSNSPAPPPTLTG